jgi:hypothetical protein
MNRLRFAIHFVAVLAFVALSTSLAHAQGRTWVSGVGDDINPCTRTAPCKTFSTAQSHTSINGEIDALDPGGFGTITINKSLTIDGTGTLAGILSTSTTGVTINLTDVSGNDPLRMVRLRGLTINGTGVSGSVGTRTGIRGINVSSSNPGIVLVVLEDLVIDNFINEGILFNSNGGRMAIRNVSVRNNAQAGLKVDSAGANLNRVTVENSTFTMNGNGIQVEDSARVSITNVVLGHNTTGLNVTNVSQSNQVNINRSMIAENTATGINAAGPITFSTVFVSDCMLAGNSTGIAASGNGRIFSSLNNTFAGNAADGTFTLPNNPVK